MSIDLKLNRLFVNLYQDIIDVEQKSLITEEYQDITINDMHVIEAIGKGEPKSSSAVAKKLGITMGTLTKAIDGLTEKNYVLRERSTVDKRVVLLSLLPKGMKAYDHHSAFHKNMVKAVVDQLDADEIAILEKSLGSLEGYFKQAK